jgi:hypothetical protein
VQRTSLVGEIFGYLVCLLAVVIFFMSVAGIVNSAFRIVNPTAGPHVIGARMIGGPGRHGGNFFFRSRGANTGPGPVAAPPQPFNFEGNARFDATRRLVLAIVMLCLSMAVFARAFAWLNPKQATGGGT